MSNHFRSDESIELFAALSARLNEGFDDRALVLQAAGLDEPSWVRFEAQCATLLAENADSARTRRFSEVYAAECRLLARSTSLKGLPTHDPRFLNDNAQPWREEAAAVSLDPSHLTPPSLAFGDADTADPTWPAPQPLSVPKDLDRTAEYASGRPGPVLPFSGVRGMEESGVRSAPVARSPDKPPRVGLVAPDTTVELSMNAARAPALPFASPSSPVRRLHRFDSQTGRPLATPYWVDDAVDPTKSA